jgi:hypothetical protein
MGRGVNCFNLDINPSQDCAALLVTKQSMRYVDLCELLYFSDFSLVIAMVIVIGTSLCEFYLFVAVLS